MAVHNTAVAGFAAASHYDRIRPEYPADAIVKIIERCKLTPASIVVDVGAGTGKFTRMLVARGLNVTAVEPVQQMRDTLQASLPAIKVIDAPAERIPLPDACVDVITCAQAFHWFASRAALQEFARILKPNGYLALIWNFKDERLSWAHEIEEFLTQFQGDAPRFRTGRWRESFTVTPSLFAPYTSDFYANPHATDAEGVAQRALTNSFVAKRSEDEKAAVRKSVLGILLKHGFSTPETPCSIPYETQVVITQRL